MKAVLVTFSRAYNNGALLQCYALSRAIEEAGNECVVLDYYPYYFKELYNVTKRFKITHPPIKTYLHRFALRKVLKKRNKNYNDFICKNLRMSETFGNIEKIDRKCPDADFFVTGSDQVWNYGCTYFDKVFFLDFEKARKSKRYSYAACLGFKRNKLNDEYFSEYKRRLSGYEGLSVREASSVPIIEEITGEKVRLDVDPTILLEASEWERIAEKCSESLPYILIYYVQRTEKLQIYAKMLQKIYRDNNEEVKVICVPCNTSYEVLSGKIDKKYDFDFRPDVGPAQLLGLIKGAKFVLTNSFHGSVFSIIFEKSFLAQEIEDSGKLNVRIDELLKQFGLDDRVISDKRDLKKAFDNINYMDVRNILDSLRRDSLEYIRNMGKNEEWKN